MKKINILFVLGFIAACSQSPKDLSALQEELADKKEAISSLQVEIDSLNKRIAVLDTTKVEKVKLAPVEVKMMKAEEFKHYVRLNATVSSKENVLVSAEGNGRVISVNAKEGNRVQRGQTILRLESNFIEGQLQEAKSALKLAKTTYERRARLWKQDSIGSEIEFLSSEANFTAATNRVKQAEAQYQNTFVKAPVSGTLDVISVNEGEFVAAGTPVARVVDLSNLELQTDLSESYLNAVKVGDEVTVKIPALGLEQQERIIFTSQFINPANRSVTVKVGLENNNKMIKPNLLAEIKIRDYENLEALVLPSMSIQKDLKGDYVFTATTNNENKTVVAKKYVSLGRSFGDKTEIKSGVSPGDNIVVTGFSDLNDGQLVIIQ
jgi:membrane fusion protein (multidrug efflux system)